VEVIAVIHSVFRSIGFADYTMRINNRKVLRGFLSFLELPESLASDTIRLIDKIDKIGISKIEQELQTLLGSEAIVSSILEYLKLRTLSNAEKLEYLAAVDHPDVRAGVAELREVYEGVLALGVDESRLVIDPAIARGLDYYTGTIVETFVNGHENLGSIASGGRYEDLASNFINRKLPGVGVSIGQTRLFYVLRELGYISVGPRTPSVFFVARFEDTPPTHAFELLSRLRTAGIPAESALDPGQKIGKQIAAADKKGIAYVVMAGSDEIAQGVVQVKKLSTGESREFPVSGDPADWRF
jgi:histidyl-tRNA synthetase